MTPVFVQIKLFLNTIAIGLIIGIVFDFYRAIRFLVRPKKLTTDVLDLFISILLTGIAFLLLLFSSRGEVRLYVFLGIGIGVILYIKYCSVAIFTLWLNWLKFLGKSIQIFFTVFFYPFVLLKKILFYPLGLASILIYKIYLVFKLIFGKPCRCVKSILYSLWISLQRLKKP